MFELDQFVSDCRTALRQDRPQQAVQEVVRRAVATPGDMLRAIGEPKRAEMQTLYRSDDLTILNVIWAPWMNLLPHNHQMWAIIGLYTGREDNIFWRRGREATVWLRLRVREHCVRKTLSRWAATLSIP